MQNAVIPPVIVALKLEEFGASGGGASQTKRDLYYLSAAVGEAYAIGTWNDSGEHLGNFIFEIVLGAEGEAVLDGFAYRLDHFGGCIPQDVRSPSQGVIDVGVAIHIMEGGRAAMSEVERMGKCGAAEAAEHASR